MDKNDIIDYVMNTPHNTNKAVLNSMLNQLTEGGSGGDSSDFSTATVMIVNDISEYSEDFFSIFDMHMACAVMQGGTGATVGELSGDLIFGSHNAMLYKGRAFLAFDIASTHTYQISASGGIQQMGDNFMITGDCTITISGGGDE